MGSGWYRRAIKKHVHLHKVGDKLDIVEMGRISITDWEGIRCSQYCCWTMDSKIFAFTTECGLVMWCRRTDLKNPLGKFKTRSSCYKIVFLEDDTLLAFVTRDDLYIAPVHNFKNVVQWIDFSKRYTHRRSMNITGLCVTPNSKSIFVSHEHGIDEFQIVGVQTLVEVCVASIVKHRETHWQNFD